MNTKRLLISAGLVLLLLSLSYFPFVHHTEAYEAGIRWNRVSGEVSIDGRGGFHISPPWTAVSRIDTRPMRVCITSRGRSFNCKLARFEPKEYKKFIETEGFRYFWLDNRLSFNFGYNEEYRGVRDLLRGYAFSAKKYPFVIISEEYAE